MLVRKFSVNGSCLFTDNLLTGKLGGRTYIWYGVLSLDFSFIELIRVILFWFFEFLMKLPTVNMIWIFCLYKKLYQFNCSLDQHCVKFRSGSVSVTDKLSLHWRWVSKGLADFWSKIKYHAVDVNKRCGMSISQVVFSFHTISK